MKKVIHLTESDLTSLIKKIINEQQTNFLEIKGSANNEPITSPKILQDLGLKVDNLNYKGRWVLKLANIPKTFFNTKNLSLFELLQPTSPQGKEDYLKIYVSRFTKKIYNKDKTLRQDSILDKTTQPKIEYIVSGGSKTFDTYYNDPTDNNYVWRISQVIGSGNGLLAFARALVSSTNRYPNKITISLSSSNTTGESYQFDSNKIGNIKSILNSVNSLLAASILNGPRMNIKNLDEVGMKFINKSNEVISNSIVNLLYFMDRNFIPQNQKNISDSLPKYNSESFLTLLNSLPKLSNESVQYIFDKNKKALRRDLEKRYKDVERKFRDEIVNQYKTRLLAYFKSRYGDKNAENLINQIQFTTLPSLSVIDAILNSVFGAEYLKVD